MPQLAHSTSQSRRKALLTEHSSAQESYSKQSGLLSKKTSSSASSSTLSQVEGTSDLPPPAVPIRRKSGLKIT